MGQKINPKSLRIGINKNWSSRWFFGAQTSQKKGQSGVPGGRSSYAKFLEEDEVIRKVIEDKINAGGIADVHIERTHNDVKILIKVARPGLVIGRGGKGIEELTQALEQALKKLRGEGYNAHMSVNIEELKRSEISAQYVAQQIAWDLEKRFPYRRTMKKYLDQVMQNREVRGAKLLLGGRLGGAEISRKESLKRGALPLQTLRANIDYGQVTAYTTYGTIGVKVWVYKGESMSKKEPTFHEERESRVLRKS